MGIFLLCKWFGIIFQLEIANSWRSILKVGFLFVFTRMSSIQVRILSEWIKIIQCTLYMYSTCVFTIPDSRNLGILFFQKEKESFKIRRFRTMMSMTSFSRLTISLGVKNYQIDGLFWSKIFVIKSQKSLGFKKVNKCNK